MRKIAMVKLVTWYLGVTKILSFELVFSLLFVSDFEIIGGPHCNNLLVFWQIHPKTLKKYFWSESIILNLIDDAQFFVFSFHEGILRFRIRYFLKLPNFRKIRICFLFKLNLFKALCMEISNSCGNIRWK